MALSDVNLRIIFSVEDKLYPQNYSRSCVRVAIHPIATYLELGGHRGELLHEVGKKGRNP